MFYIYILYSHYFIFKKRYIKCVSLAQAPDCNADIITQLVSKVGDVIGDWLAGKNKNKTVKKKIVNSPNDSKSIDSKNTQNTDGKKESNSSDRKKQKLKEKGEENLKTNKKNYFSRKSKGKKATLDSNFSSHDSMDAKNKGEYERGAGKVIYVCSGKYLQSGNGFTLTKILLRHK